MAAPDARSETSGAAVYGSRSEHWGRPDCSICRSWHRDIRRPHTSHLRLWAPPSRSPSQPTLSESSPHMRRAPTRPYGCGLASEGHTRIRGKHCLVGLQVAWEVGIIPRTRGEH